MRRIKFLFTTAVVLLVLGGGAVVAMRIGREKFAAPSEIKPGIFGIKSAGGIYLYGARVGAGAILFDTGADPQAHPVDGLLAALGVGRGEVREIFLTHGHLDHIAGVPQLPGARTYLGAADLGLASGAVAPDALVAKLMAKALPIPPVTITNPLTGRATVAVGAAGEGKVVKAIPVGGHTAGSYVYLYDGVLFAGDIVIVKQGRLEPTPAIFDAHPAETRAAIASLKTLLTGETVETICTAHGGCTPQGLGSNLLDDLIGRLGT